MLTDSARYATNAFQLSRSSFPIAGEDEGELPALRRSHALAASSAPSSSPPRGISDRVTSPNKPKPTVPCSRFSGPGSLSDCCRCPRRSRRQRSTERGCVVAPGARGNCRRSFANWRSNGPFCSTIPSDGCVVILPPREIVRFDERNKTRAKNEFRSKIPLFTIFWRFSPSSPSLQHKHSEDA